MRCLVDDPCTIEELVEETGMSLSVVRGYVRCLHEKKIVYVAGYLKARNGARVIRQFAFGPDKRDCKKPVPPSPSERTRTYRERRKKLLQGQQFNSIWGQRPVG